MPYAPQKVLKGHSSRISPDDFAIYLHQTSHYIPLPITTRSIGFSTAYFFQKLYNLLTIIPEYDVYAFYRASLGIFDAKMTFIQNNYEHLRSYDGIYDFKRFVNFIYNWKTIVPIAKFVNSLGVFKYYDEVYCPIFTENNYDSDERIIPQSEHLTLSNLRETVVSLGNEDVLSVLRQRFYNNCAIPGTCWQGPPDNPILINADEIISENYKDEDLMLDLESSLSVIRCAQKMLPKIVDEINLLDKNGKPCLFVSNRQNNLHITHRKEDETPTDYYKRLKITGEIDDFWNLRTIGKADQIDGCLILPGELPISPIHIYPDYSIRDALAAGQNTSFSYKSAYTVLKI